MNTLYTHSDSNKRKTWFLMSGFLIFVIMVGWVFSLALGTSSILYIAVAFSVFSAFASYWWSDKIVLRMSGAKEIKFEDNKEIYRLVENLCITAGLPLPRIYIIDDPSPNAFATGRNPDNAVVALTKGLIQKLDRNEIEAVIAHELSHIGNRDILIATLTTVLVGFIVLLADWFWYWVFFRGIGGSGDDNRVKIALMLAAVVLAIVAPIFAYMMQFAISRKQEFKADADAALLTRYPEALASALEKISGDNSDLKTANRATAHMYISTPLKKEKKKERQKKKGFFSKAFMSHPPVDERIAALRGMKV